MGTIEQISIREVYDDYVETYGKDISYRDFNKLIKAYNEGLSNLILLGYEVPLGYRLGNIKGVRIKRRKGSKRIDFGTTNKHGYDKDGNLVKKYYFTEKYYGRIKWSSGIVYIPNKSFYKFEPAECYKKDKNGEPVGLMNKFFKYIYDEFKKARFPIEENLKERKNRNGRRTTTTSR